MRDNFLRFAFSCRRGDVDYALTPAADTSAYARCFAVFCRRLVCDRFTDGERARLADALRQSVWALRSAPGSRPDGKPYRQLLAFTLSALAALSALDEDPLRDLIGEQVAEDIATMLERSGALRGVPGRGNQAMFLAVFLLHARERLSVDTGPAIAEWLRLHLSSMNRFGFWGPDGGMTHLQFQNGYHQYQIFEYPRRDESAGDGGGCRGQIACRWSRPFRAVPGRRQLLRLRCGVRADAGRPHSLSRDRRPARAHGEHHRQRTTG